MNPHLKSNQIGIARAPAGCFGEQEVCFVMVIPGFEVCRVSVPKSKKKKTQRRQGIWKLNWGIKSYGAGFDLMVGPPPI